MAKKKIKVGMAPSHPGQFFRRQVIDELGLSITKAAEVLKVRRASVSDLIHGKASLSADMALRIELAFGLDMNQMLQMQAWYDAHSARKKAADLDIQKYAMT